MNPEPPWRITLYWGTIVTFFSLPLIIFILHLSFIAWPQSMHGDAPRHLGEFKYIFEFHRTLAALVFGLAGLHTGQVIASKHLEERSNTKNNHKTD